MYLPSVYFYMFDKPNDVNVKPAWLSCRHSWMTLYIFPTSPLLPVLFYMESACSSSNSSVFNISGSYKHWGPENLIQSKYILLVTILCSIQNMPDPTHLYGPQLRDTSKFLTKICAHLSFSSTCRTWNVSHVSIALYHYWLGQVHSTSAINQW